MKKRKSQTTNDSWTDRKIKRETILAKARSKEFTYGEILKLCVEKGIELQEDDILEVGWTDGWNDSDTAREGCYDLKLIRPRLENDKEYQKRMEEHEELKARNKKARYQNYLKLKEEFE